MISYDIIVKDTDQTGDNKMKWKKKLSVILCGLTLFTWLTPTSVKAEELKYWPDGPEVGSVSAIVMEANTGAILYEKNIHEQLYPASITKILTSLIAIENNSLSETVTFSHDAVYKIEGTHIARDVDEKMTLEETLYAVLLGSANECAYATAEHVGGTYDNFIKLMNERAKEIGCVDSTFCNPHGLPDPNHVTSAYDMALISREAIMNETFRLIIGTSRYTIPPTNKHTMETYLINHHAMLNYYKTGKYIYDSCIGGKTGFTDAALNTLVTYAERDGMTLICVVMRAGNGVQYTDTTSLLNYCFDNFQLQNISKDDAALVNERITDQMNFQSTESYVKMKENASVVIPKTATFKDTTSKMNYDAKKNKTMGSLDYYYGEHHVGGSEIQIVEKKVEQFPFANSPLEVKGETKKVVQIDWKFIFILVLIIAALLGLAILVVYVIRNFYLLRYEFNQRRKENLKGVLHRGVNSKKRKGDKFRKN